MAVVVNSQQGAGGTSAAATTQAITPSGIVAGRSLVVLTANAAGSTGLLTGVADTGGNTYTLPDPPRVGVSGGVGTFIACAYVHNCVAPGTITVTTDSRANRKVLLLEITGLQNTPHDIAGEDGAAATSLTNVAPSVAMTQADFVIAFVGRPDTAEPTSITAGWTLSQTNTPDTTNPILRAGWQEFSASGASGTCGFTFAASTRAGCGTIAFKVPLAASRQHVNVTRRVWAGR